MALRPSTGNIQAVIARRQLDTKISILIRCDTRDFLFSVAAQNDQRIIAEIFPGPFGWRCIGKINLLRRGDFQTSVQEAWWNSVHGSPNNQKNDSGANHIFKQPRHEGRRLKNLKLKY